MLVLKFGGSSVGSPAAIKQLIAIVGNQEHRGRTRLVVVSAFSGVTDSLIEIARLAEANDGLYEAGLASLKERHQAAANALLNPEELALTTDFLETGFNRLSRLLDGVRALQELSPRSLDQIQSFGEYFSAFIIAAAFRSSAEPADFLDARLVLRTDDNFGNARYDKLSSFTNIKALMAARPKLQITTGFIAATANGQTTTLGRGGSDLSCAIFGAALGASELEIWSDVDGILSADPKLVKGAFSLDSLSYVEAMELSHFGAKVLYPPSVRPALEAGIPIRIRNSFNPSHPGTLIAISVPDSPYPVRGVSSIKDIALLRVQGSGMMGVCGFSSRLFGSLAARQVNVMLISQASSEYSICFAVLPKDAATAAMAIKAEFEREIADATIDQPIIEKALSIIAVVGARMKRSSGIAGKVFNALGRNGINIVAIAQGSSELNISAVIAQADEAKALNAVHEAFFLSGIRSVNLFLVGAGKVGSSLLDQITAQPEIVLDRFRVRIKLIGLADSKTMILNAKGLDPLTARSLLSDLRQADQLTNLTAAEQDNGLIHGPFDQTAFLRLMRSFNLPNSVFCDCTASDQAGLMYPAVLKAAIAVVSPNKQANIGPFKLYRELIDYSRDRAIPYLYESSVGAGLPLISTIRELVLSGDQLIKVEAVLQSSLSYVFNNFDGSKSFSSLFQAAVRAGYAEADPRDDLIARDAARQTLILAREAGLALEANELSIEPLIPVTANSLPAGTDLFSALSQFDAVMESRRAQAAAQGQVLRYLTVIENGQASLSLQAVASDSLFGQLTSTDKLLVITSRRYQSQPLVIKGPAAGAQATAAAVLADLVRIA